MKWALGVIKSFRVRDQLLLKVFEGLVAYRDVSRWERPWMPAGRRVPLIDSSSCQPS